MNKLFLIGNLTRDPELRTTQSGDAVCTFTVAVNRRRRSNAEAGQPEADFFRVSAWRQLGENCARYLAKGKKVCVSGPVSVNLYTGTDGQARAQLQVTADDVEYLTPKGETQPAQAEDFRGTPQEPANFPQNNSGYVQVDDEELPF